MTIRRELIDELLKDYKTPQDILGEDGLLKELTKAVIDRCLETELDTHLGYPKHARKGNSTGNVRNGHSQKTLKGEQGHVDIEVPRDRQGTFEPQLVKKGKHMHEHTRSFADLIIGQREQGLRIGEVWNTSSLTQAQLQAGEKLETDPIQNRTDAADTVEHLMASQDTLQPPHRGISRRTAMLTLAELVVGGVAGSSLILLACAQQPAAPASRPVGTTLYTYRGHSNIVWKVAWSPDGKRIASGGDDDTVQVWDATTGGNVYTYRGHSHAVLAVAWSPDGKRIASGGDDKTVQVWDATTGGNVYTYRGHSDHVYAVAWSPDGKRIASGSGFHLISPTHNTVQVWDATTGGNVYTYRRHSHEVVAVAWSPDGKRIASGSWDQTVRVWDAANGRTVYTYQGHTYLVNAVAWSPDGKRIASGSEDMTVQVWDATTGGNVYTYRGHSSSVYAVAWSPDGKRIASGGDDDTVQVWDATTGGNVYTYRGHSSSVWSVAWSPDGKRIASGSGDKTVQVWVAG